MYRSAYKYTAKIGKDQFPELRASFNEILNELIDIMSLREKILLSELPEGKTSLLKRFLTFQVRCKFLDQWIKKNPMINCSVDSGQKGSCKSELAEMIIDELCIRLRDTCRLRVVK